MQKQVWQHEQEATDRALSTVTYSKNIEKDECLCSNWFPPFSLSFSLSTHSRVVLPIFRVVILSSVDPLQKFPHRQTQRQISHITQHPVKLTMEINPHQCVVTSWLLQSCWPPSLLLLDIPLSEYPTVCSSVGHLD